MTEKMMKSLIRINKDGSGNAGFTHCSAVPQDAVIAGEAKETGEVHFQSSDSKVVVGSWQCTPYAEILSCSDFSEYSTILQGKVALTNPDGSVEVFEAGDSYVLPVGWQGRFEVIETLRKIYVITAA